MSTTSSSAKTKQRTVAQRNTDAMRRLRAALAVDDTKVLGATIAEIAAHEAEQSPSFRDRVLATYNELLALKPKASVARIRKAAGSVELTPLPGTEGIHIDPFGGVDPFLLLRLYGPNQLRKALAGFSYSALKEAASAVRQRHPDSKPAKGRSADSMVNYIVEQLAPGN